MVQSNYKKVTFILIAALVVVSLLIFWSLSRKTNNQPENERRNSNNEYNLPNTSRPMTEQEKVERQIDPVAEVEVVNDQAGMFIYKIKN